MFLADEWKDFAVLDTGGGEKLERWGRYILARPDPQTIWPRGLSDEEWRGADAHYTRSDKGGGRRRLGGTLPLEQRPEHRQQQGGQGGADDPGGLPAPGRGAGEPRVHGHRRRGLLFLRRASGERLR